MLTTRERSQVFTVYNHMRAGTVDHGRLNRGLGLAQSNQESQYQTTATTCTCADWRYRISRHGGQCKHQIRLALTAAGEAQPVQSPARRGISALR